MLRNVYLEGELGEKYTPHMRLSFTKPSEIFRALDANFGDTAAYFIKKHEEGVGYHIDVAGNELEEPAELLLDMKEGDVIITPVPAGSKSGPAKILAAIALVVVTAGAATALAPGAFTAASVAGGGLPLYATGFGSAFGSGAAFSAALGAAGSTIAGKIALGVAASLALGGIQQMMAPDPSTDSDQEQSYLFNGAEQNIVSGDPVPVLYGRLRVPGQPISFEVSSVGAIESGVGNSYSGGGGSGELDFQTEQQVASSILARG
jgi:predicted phage tail protein